MIYSTFIEILLNTYDIALYSRDYKLIGYKMMEYVNCSCFLPNPINIIVKLQKTTIENCLNLPEQKLCNQGYSEENKWKPIGGAETQNRQVPWSPCGG